MQKSILALFVVFMVCSCATVKSPYWIAEETLQQRRQAVVEVLANGQIKGTGAFIAADGLVLTASHLFENDDVKVEIISAEEKRYSAKLLRRNRRADLALVQVETQRNDFTFIPLAEKAPVQGEEIGCFGAALWNPVMLLKGKMANSEGCFSEYPSANGYLRSYYVSSAIPGLASGGPWINSEGQLFGVQSGHLLDQGKDAGIAMVGRLDDIQLLLKSKGSVHTAGINAWIWPLWTSDKAQVDAFPEGTEGLLVNVPHKGGALDKAGIKQFELIVSCNGVKTRRRRDLLNEVAKFKPNDKVVFEVRSKDGKVRKVDVALSDMETGKL